MYRIINENGLAFPTEFEELEEAVAFAKLLLEFTGYGERVEIDEGDDEGYGVDVALYDDQDNLMDVLRVIPDDDDCEYDGDE